MYLADDRKTTLQRILSFEHSGAYQLYLRFDDGREQVIDFDPLLEGPIFGELHDPARFREVQLDPDFGALVWPNGTDIDPMVLYDWATYVDEIVARREVTQN
jgi:hypothetical protein